MKAILIVALATISISPVLAQRAAVVRGIGTQTCKSYVASNQVDKKFAQEAEQWILGNMTGYFRQASDDPTRTLGDAVVLETVLDICKKNAEKTIDEAVTTAISSFPETEIKTPDKK